MKILKICLTCIALVLTFAFVFLQKDDPLSADAARMLDAHQWDTSSDAYLYLLGIGTDLNKSPIEEGKKALLEIREKEKSYTSAKTLDEIESYYVESALKTKKHDLFCNLNELNCFEEVSRNLSVEKEDKVLATIKERYLTFLSMNDLRSLAEPHMMLTFPHYEFLTKGNRLANLEALQKARSCCPEEAAENLYALIELLKKHSSQTDYLIGRLISYSLINDTIESLSFVLREYGVPGKKLEPLSKQQLSLSRVMNGEFAFSRSFTNIAFLGEFTHWTPEWIQRVLLKRNMTTNAIAPLYKNVVRISESKQSEFELLAKHEEKIQIENAWLRNLLGSWLNKQALDYTFKHYIKRGFDLNAKIALFNGTRGERITPAILKRIVNPYYDEVGHEATIDVENKKACFDGPFVDNKNFRCLNLIGNS